VSPSAAAPRYRRDYFSYFAVAFAYYSLYLAQEAKPHGGELMARICTICNHHRRDSMDKAMLRGEQLKAVARRYSVSEDALGRHRKHMRLMIAKAAAMVEQKDLAYGSALLAEIGRIRADADVCKWNRSGVRMCEAHSEPFTKD
jgi:hypothetical protein